MYDSSGAPIIENGKTKTLIKIHVFDNACDPHSTLTDIMKSAKDNELDLFRIPISNYNASKGKNEKLSPAIDIIRLGLSSGAFEVVNLSGENLTIDPNNQTDEQIKEHMFYLTVCQFNKDELKNGYAVETAIALQHNQKYINFNI
jgi:hypothetical protein